MQWAIVSLEPGKQQLKRIPIPVPASGEVLIKVDCAPINISDVG